VGPISIQTLTSRVEAERLLEKLNQAGFFAYYTPVRQRDKVLYHVRIGIFSDEREASSTIALLQKKASIQGSISKLQ
jgi:cell division septation protein DedD